MKKISCAFLSYFLCMSVHAQKEWSNWYFDGHTLLTFKNGYAQVDHNFINPVPPDSNFLNYYYFGAGGISYSDPVTGDMKFLIASRLGYGTDFVDFPNDTFIRSCPNDYSYHIIPFHNDPNKFYVIQFQDYLADLLQQITGLQVRCPNAIGLGYSIVDLSLNGGKGDFSLVNQVITGPLTQQITTVKHANSKDVWVIVHPYNTNQFSARLVTDAGIQPPVNSTIGPFISGRYENVIGTLTASHDGKLLAGYSALGTGVQLFDFDNATGNITNYRTLPIVRDARKLQFSPDNSKLYCLTYDGIFQYDLNQPNISSTLTKIYGEVNGLIYDMQLALDGKIYVTKTTSGTPGGNDYAEHTGAIECPNLPQYACNFNPQALEFLTVAFQDLINDFIIDPKAPAITKFTIGNDTSICFGSYTISAPVGWQSYKWSTGETTRQITVHEAGVYHVLTGNTGFSCPSGYGYITVGDKAIKLDLGKDTTLCKGLSYALHIDNKYSNITWQNGSQTRDSLITNSSSFIINADDKNGCFTKDTIGIYFSYYPIADFGPDTTICNNQPLVLTLFPPKVFSNGGIYSWQDGSTNDNYTVTTSGKYCGSATYQGCTVSDTINVSYITANNVSLGSDTTLCAGDSVRLQSNVSNGTYLWNTGETSAAIYAKLGGLYWIKVRAGSCTLSDSINVAFTDKPSFSLGTDTAICEKENLVLNAGNGYESYLWQDGSAGNSFTVTSSGLYWVRLTQNGCSAFDSLYVDYKLLPPLELGRDTGICIGKSLLLDAYSALSAWYTWQDQSINSSYAVNSRGSYSVKVMGINGCANSDTINVSVSSPPYFSLGNDTVLCEMNVLSYNYNLPNVSYLWNDGSTQNSYIINKPGAYSLVLTQSGCTTADTIKINYKPRPYINIGKDTTLCAGSSITLNAMNAGALYVWQDNSRLPSYEVMKAGIYTVDVDLNGCNAGDSILIDYKNSPAFSLGNDTSICAGQFLILQAGIQGTFSYLWQDGSTQAKYTVTQSGLYTLQLHNECGSAVDEISITSFTCNLEMPNAFTPNDDGLNDVFRIKYPFPMKQFRISIYNKWGQKIFESDDINHGWDGTFKGSKSSAGIYVWTITATDTFGKIQNGKGLVTLLK